MVHPLIGPSFGLFDDFQFILKNNTSKGLLLLAENWNHYSTWLAQKGPLRDELAAEEVKCRSGNFYRLGNTFFLVDDLVIDYSMGRMKSLFGESWAVQYDAAVLC